MVFKVLWLLAAPTYTLLSNWCLSRSIFLVKKKYHCNVYWLCQVGDACFKPAVEKQNEEVIWSELSDVDTSIHGLQSSLIVSYELWATCFISLCSSMLDSWIEHVGKITLNHNVFHLLKWERCHSFTPYLSVLHNLLIWTLSSLNSLF